MENQEAVGAEQPDKRRGEQRIGPGLGEKYLAVPGFFEEDALRPGVKVMVIPGQVLPGIFQVKVVRDALRQSVVDGLVGEQEVLVHDREVDKQGEPEGKEEDEEDDRGSGLPGLGVVLGHRA